MGITLIWIGAIGFSGSNYYFLAGILMLVGGFVWVGIIIQKKEKTVSLIREKFETEKYGKEVEYKLLNYINTNKGIAFSVQALINRLEEFIEDIGTRNYCKRNIESILNKLIYDGKIEYSEKNGISHYLIDPGK